MVRFFGAVQSKDTEMLVKPTCLLTKAASVVPVVLIPLGYRHCNSSQIA